MNETLRPLRERYLRASMALARINMKRLAGYPTARALGVLDASIQSVAVNMAVLTDMLIAKNVCTAEEIETKMAEMMEIALKTAQEDKTP